MTREEAFKLTPEISYVIFAKGKYRVAYVAEEFGVTWIGIYDEPPSLHVDRIQAAHCSLPPAEGAEKSCLNCRFHNSPTYHDKMWCRDCQQFNHYEAIKSMAKSAEAILHEHIDKQSMDELSVNVWPDMLEAMTEFAASQRQPQPTAEGAEEILESIVESLGEPINIHNHIFEIRPYTVEHKTEWWIFHKEVASGEPLAQWLDKFATLHAQKIADKKVSERLREELIAYGKVLRSWGIAIPSDILECSIDEYLKTREK